MSEKIEPALTPEEWAAGRVSRRYLYIGRPPHDHHDDPTYSVRGATGFGLVDGDFVVADSEWPGFENSVVVDANGRHAIAAYALHGQPLGFTWEDVDDVRAVAEDMRVSARENDRPAGRSAMYAERYDSLADRIAALLPPGET